MSEAEKEVLSLLGQAFTRFSQLEVLHGSDVTEMQLAIHAAQNIVLARAGLRETGVFRPDATTNLDTDQRTMKSHLDPNGNRLIDWAGSSPDV